MRAIYFTLLGMIAFAGMRYCFHLSYKALETAGNPNDVTVILAVVCALVVMFSAYKVQEQLTKSSDWKYLKD